MSNLTLEVTDETFKKEVLEAKEPVLVDFWAAWCGPCRIVAPIIKEIAEENKGKIKVFKLNVDENQQTATKYEILSIPTLLVFEKGKVQKKLIGALSKNKLVEELSDWLK